MIMPGPIAPPTNTNNFSTHAQFDVDYSPELTLAILREPTNWDLLQVFVSEDEEEAKVESSLGKTFFAGLREKENVQIDANWNKRVVYDISLVFGSYEITATQEWEFTQLPGLRCRIDRHLYNFQDHFRNSSGLEIASAFDFVESVAKQQNVGIEQLIWLQRASSPSPSTDAGKAGAAPAALLETVETTQPPDSGSRTDGCPATADDLNLEAGSSFSPHKEEEPPPQKTPGGGRRRLIKRGMSKVVV